MCLCILLDTTGLTESDGSSVPFLLIVVSAAGSIALAVLIAGIVLMSLYCHKRQKSKLAIFGNNIIPEITGNDY